MTGVQTCALPIYVLDSQAPEELPSWAGSLRMTGVRALDKLWDVRLQDGHVIVEPQ